MRPDRTQTRGWKKYVLKFIWFSEIGIKYIKNNVCISEKGLNCLVCCIVWVVFKWGDGFFFVGFMYNYRSGLVVKCGSSVFIRMLNWQDWIWPRGFRDNFVNLILCESHRRFVCLIFCMHFSINSFTSSSSSKFWRFLLTEYIFNYYVFMCSAYFLRTLQFSIYTYFLCHSTFLINQTKVIRSH